MNNDKENVNKTILVTRSSMPPFDEYVEAIRPLWDSHWLTNMGTYHKELERELAEFLDVPQVSLTSNGHMALELAIQAFDFPKGGEVITTPFTFISTTHAIVRNGLQPVFCDVKRSDGTIDEDRIEDLINEKTVAILPVHVYGNACNVDRIQEIAYKYGLNVIYDAAHAFGVSYDGKGIGNYGDAAIFSFHATKVFNTIEGGAVVCKNREMYDKLYNLKNFGIRGEDLVVSVGANAKMNEFAAIMGLCNLKHFPEAIEHRKKVYDHYWEKFSEIQGIRLLDADKRGTRNYAYFPIVIEDDFGKKRDGVYDTLKRNQIRARKYFYPCTSDQACFKNKYKNADLSVARDLSHRVLSIPFYEELTIEECNRIIDTILL